MLKQKRCFDPLLEKSHQFCKELCFFEQIVTSIYYFVLFIVLTRTHG